MNEKILASVGGLQVTEADVAAMMQALGPRGERYASPEGKRALVEELVAQKLFLLDARKNLLEAEPAFQARLKQAKEQLLTEYAIRKAVDKADVKAALSAFIQSNDEADDMNAWFDKVKAIARDLGFADDMKAYKADPTAFKGSVADVSMILRVAVTGKQNAPDLYTVMHILGRERTMARIDAMIQSN